MADVRWRPILAPRAIEDLSEILVWTREQIGLVQAEAYRELIFETLRILEDGPDALGVRRRDDIIPGLRLIHTSRRGRHFVVFRVSSVADRTIDVLRILHDQMDLVRHLQTS